MNRPVVFRPDVGAGAGLGHLRRCLSLAIALRRHGFDSIFEIDEGRDVASDGFTTGVAEDARAFVIDSYRATGRDLVELGRNGAKVIVIDDLADNALPVDLVINPGVDAESLEYVGARNTGLGIEYALLRPEFAGDPKRIHAAKGRRLLITMGGGDSHELTPRLLAAVAQRGFEAIDVIVGPFFTNAQSMHDTVHRYPAVRLHRNPSDIRALMLQADLALTGGGQTIYELAATATPAAAIEVAANQSRNLEGFSKRDALAVVGRAEEADVVEKAADAVATLAGDRGTRVAFGTNGRRLVDGRGAERAARRIVELIGNEA
jgi:UDP-2,4-diacetamido-2,4,6-trideoxy-beta-L-altropyranose hydrolase